MNIIVTGGTGFLGSHLIAELLKKGYSNIISIDINDPQKTYDVKYIKADFSDKEVLSTYLEEDSVIFHLAALVGVDNCDNNPQLVNKINEINTKKLFQSAFDKKVRRIIFTSSSEVYGNSNDIPYMENGKLEPISEYGKAKVNIEKYLYKEHIKYPTSVGIVRLFNAYGPGQRSNFVVPIFIQKALHNQPITIFGDGNQIRCFTYVDDIIEGIIKLFQYEKTKFEILNIANKNKYTINDLANVVLKNIPASLSSIEHMEYDKKGSRAKRLEVYRRIPCVEKAKTVVGFEARTSLMDGIRKTLINHEKI